MGKKKAAKKASKKRARASRTAAGVAPAADLKRIFERRKVRKRIHGRELLIDGGTAAVEGSSSTTMSVRIVVGECISPCVDGICDWVEVAHRYLEEGETVCTEVSRTTTNGGVDEQKVIVTKPTARRG